MDRELGKNGRMAAHIRKLFSDGGYRRSCGQFVCEGDKLLKDAVLSGAEVLTVVYTDGIRLPETAEGTEFIHCSEELMRSLSPQKSPQGAMFICALREREGPIPQGFLLVLDGVQDPGNVGTVLRTAEAFGAASVILCPGCADPFLHKTVRASMGSVFRQDFRLMTREELLRIVEDRGTHLFIADGYSDMTIDLIPKGSCAVAVGSEGSGVSRELRMGAEGSVRIPMKGRCESLNAAVAASVIMWEVSGRRGSADEGRAGCV
ncbi:MAG: RNA methyltransferase [Oscillospiraceae bacterium]|nr:RNA methyltransferase [Oscillospiraceae bacterium]